MQKRFFYIIFLIFLFSCEKEIKMSTNNSSNLVVVDGTITDEQKIQTIKISYSINQLNEIPKPVSDASVVISNEDSTWILSEQPANSGIYASKNKFGGQIGKNYSLIINNQNNIYSAKTYLVKCEPFVPLTYSKDDKDSLFHLDEVATAYVSSQPTMWEILLDWSMVAGYTNTAPENCKARLLFYSLETIDVSEILPPEMDEIYFPEGTIITERKYSLTPEHAEYIRDLLLETNWQGGLLNSEHANLKTNLSSGATGFFGGCSVESISLTVVKK